MPDIRTVTFACENPGELADFWADALGNDREHTPPEFLEALEDAGIDPTDGAAVSDPSGVDPRLFFLRMPTSPEASMPIHIDVVVADRPSTVDRLERQGATTVETKPREFEDDRRWTVMRDPEGNGFCVYGADAVWYDLPE